FCFALRTPNRSPRTLGIGDRQGREARHGDGDAEAVARRIAGREDRRGRPWYVAPWQRRGTELAMAPSGQHPRGEASRAFDRRAQSRAARSLAQHAAYSARWQVATRSGEHRRTSIAAALGVAAPGERFGERWLR